ncbi:MAG TPA: DUF4398 domain-containing protein [Polyangiaceae bacterium]
MRPEPADHAYRRLPRVRVRLLVAAGIALSTLVGCGNVMYAVAANRASAKLEEARHAGAEEDAPYEYWYAKLHLEKASSEASEADYSDAIHLAEVAEEHAAKAIRLAQEAKRGAGR